MARRHTAQRRPARGRSLSVAAPSPRSSGAPERGLPALIRSSRCCLASRPGWCGCRAMSTMKPSRRYSSGQLSRSRASTYTQPRRRRPMTDAFERATERAEAATRQRRRERSAQGRRKGFRIHATVFIGVQIVIVAVWALQWHTGGTGYPWFVYPLLGWGAGLAAHYVAVRDSYKRGGSA